MKKIAIVLAFSLAAACAYAGGSTEQQSATKQKLTYFFPVQVAGPLANAMGDMVNKFNAAHPDIAVEPVYSGNYNQTVQKAITAAKGGNPPGVIVAPDADLLLFLGMNLVENLDQFMTGTDTGYTDNFYPGFLANSKYDGKIWSLPFQRSLPVFYWNKDQFTEVGLDPNKPPVTWDDVIDYAQKLVKRDDQGTVTRWGVEEIQDSWIIQGLIVEAGGTFQNDAGTKAYFDTPAMTKSLGFWDKLINDLKVMPHQQDYGATARDFVAGTTAMMINSTGSYSFVAQSAGFSFGVTTMPRDEADGYPVGGGNMYILKGLSDAQKKAAWEFAKWMTTPAVCAEWTIDSGYICSEPKGYSEPGLISFAKEHPFYAAIPSKLKYAQKERQMYNGSEIDQAVTDTISNVLSRKISIADGLKNLQTQADQILAPYNK